MFYEKIWFSKCICIFIIYSYDIGEQKIPVSLFFIKYIIR